ncbi:FecR family protein [Dyella sedimenti]|uniref:FecR family protein n=1 Tax=Dyella sedimenti TaxID=2919947 RepID=UPI001FA9D807|nr:FecR domain-containing protein [Dyella sedimenti]
MSERTPFDAARQARRVSEQAVAWYIEQQEPLDERQRVAFLNWLRASPRHVAEYFAVARMHGDLKVAAGRKTLTPEELVEQAGRDNPVVMFPRLGGGTPREPRPPRRHASRVRQALASMAGVVAAVALAWLGVAHWRAMHGQVERSYAGDAQAVRSVSLPDGTLVQLDRGGAIDVHYDGAYRRIEVVRGNALFDVGKDAARPMLVNVGGHVLQDIGTVFDVRRDATGDTLTVISGRVRVLNAPASAARGAADAWLQGDAVADLMAGQQIELGKAAAGAVHPVALAQVTAWLPAEIRFQRETIGDVARRFNAYTARPLRIEDEKLAGERISGIFHADNPQAFTAYLSTLPDVRVIEEKDCVRIVAVSAQAEAKSRRL